MWGDMGEQKPPFDDWWLPIMAIWICLTMFIMPLLMIGK